jgi:hypothetical protein
MKVDRRFFGVSESRRTLRVFVGGGLGGFRAERSAKAVIPREAKRSRGIQFGLCFHRAVPVNKPQRGEPRKPRATPWGPWRSGGNKP